MKGMNQMEQDKIGIAYRQVVAKAWSDPSYKAKLLADPRAALTAAGVAVPAGVAIQVVEDTDKVAHLVLPPRPTELSEEDLKKVTGGFTLIEMRLLPAVQFGAGKV
jgi:hypothetical protein